MPGYAVGALEIDSLDNVWVLTSAGLSVRWVAEDSWTTYVFGEDMPYSHGTDIAVDAQDNVWLAFYDGLGVRHAADLFYRFFIADNPYVSRSPLNRSARP